MTAYLSSVERRCIQLSVIWHFRKMNKLELNIEPSFESYDFQVRIIIDCNDVYPELLGLDPIDFFKQDFYKPKSEIIIARCECGIIGCFDTTTKIEIADNMIFWSTSNSEKFKFNATEYANCIDQAKNDKTWENIERKMERIIGSEFINYTYLNEYKLDWVSVRNSENQIKISYTRDNPLGYTDQEIFKIDWNGVNQEEAIQKAKNIRDTSGKFQKYQ